MVMFTELVRQFWDTPRKFIASRKLRRNKHFERNTSTPMKYEDYSSCSSESKYKRSDHKAYSNATVTRRSFKRQSSSQSSTFDFNDDSEAFLSVEKTRAENGLKLVKCHIYESLESDTDEDSDIEYAKSSPTKITVQVHSELTNRNNKSNQDVKNAARQLNVTYDAVTKAEEKECLIVDETGKALSPILKVKKEKPIRRKNSNNNRLRRNLEERFVVNAFNTRYWQALNNRKRGETEKTCLIPPLRNEDFEASNMKQNAVNDNKSKATAPVQFDHSLVSELYRARITPDKILAKKLKERNRQQRVVSSNVLSILENTPPSSDEDFVRLLDDEATKLEMSDEEPLYATPMKTKSGKSSIFTTPSPSTSASSTPERKSSTSSFGSNSFFRLKEEADAQCKIMRQASKALEMSRKTSKSNIVNVRGQVEAEKILLAANCKYEKVLNEIRQTHYETALESKNVGTIQISGITANLADNFPEEFAGWFVLVMMDDKRIICSNPVDVRTTSTKISFERNFYFDNMEGTFEITGKIYCLRHSNYSQKKNQNGFASKLCIPPRKKYLESKSRDYIENNVVTSSFVPSGYFKLNVNNLKKTEGGIHITTYENSPLSGALDLHMRLCQMKINIEKTGMVNVRDHKDPSTWYRRWCTMTGPVLKFWKSPQDESFIDPEFVIDLVYCTEPIDNARREFCPRAKTLQIITSKGNYYLNMDTFTELREWKQPLNDVYDALGEWKMFQD